ncbi:chloramphenicol acetyltransferase [Cellulophaga sp. HaHaR_3_176]|uniref:CatA-like O-acetyltransferase n=1 Tax=Cellulophaga sp. HaHaR_3_176 TaxID=1942464 RepID=UPI001C1FDA9E|nr:CatA-like O-acetyltransferase [Cellulophaga sp. HaHaR_3_176]QWX84723.1 chloramphenicol acetyltransferase [Cellulophaga sp. HaHaR_3_176]
MDFLDIDSWNRKEHFHFFNTFIDPYFSVASKVDVTKTKKFSKENKVSFFAVYLHACVKAINTVENFRYRIIEDKVAVYETIHASATIIRPDHTFGFSFIKYTDDIFEFVKNVEKEKDRIMKSNSLFPSENSIDCIYCSAMPWTNFTGHKEPLSGVKESVPKLAFSKTVDTNGVLEMTVAISVNHALMDGYHVSLFIEEFQKNLYSY